LQQKEKKMDTTKVRKHEAHGVRMPVCQSSPTQDATNSKIV